MSQSHGTRREQKTRPLLFLLLGLILIGVVIFAILSLEPCEGLKVAVWESLESDAGVHTLALHLALRSLALIRGPHM